MKTVFISDTHLRHSFEIPTGELLVHTGDLTLRGSLQEMAAGAHWLGEARTKGGFKHCIFVPGNHDWLCEREPSTARLLFEEKDITYLVDQAIEINGIKFWGSPYQPAFCNWAFNVPRGPELAAVWARIPDDTNVLLTHGPPKGRLDVVHEDDGFGANPLDPQGVRWIKKHVGCADLAARIQDLKALKVHAFGHIHVGYGQETSATGVTYINSAICNEEYRAVNAPIVLDL